MKTRTFNSIHPRPAESGIALVLVLGMLVLLSGLLVAFLTTATTERTATQSASDGASARQIADSTINLVIGQIREATSGADGAGKINETQTWASQPGAIRTFTGTLSGTAKYPAGGGSYPAYKAGKDDAVFKLYSSDRLKVSSSEYNNKDLPLEVGVIEKWDRLSPDPEYADLNEPILTPRYDIDDSGRTVEPRYPIINPRARFNKDDILQDDPRTAVVEGFDAKLIVDKDLNIVNSKGEKSNQGVPYLPMPVKWLYVFRDGSVGAADLGTENNPIVGRTAFWTDDESCKLNINTSSEGTFWDTPTASSLQESGRLNGTSGAIDFTGRKLSLAASQPIKGEYQRYPGHPMTTSLSPVLGWLYGLTPTSSIYPDNAVYKQFKEAIYQISPFLGYGLPTTQGATWNSDPDASSNGVTWYTGSAGNWGPPTQVIQTKHLYATVDELLFPQQRNTGGLNPKGVLNGKLTPDALEKSRFFLSATSRAPDLNLFGRPRVTLWPIAANFDLRTNFDDLFAFTSTIYKDPNENLAADKKFHLTRSNAKSETEDFDPSRNPQNPLMYGYLQALTGGGGTGGTGPLEIPGFGGNFLKKYNLDRDQILTEIFDYMRTVNLVDTGTASRTGNVFSPYTPPFYPKGVIHNYTRQKRSIDWSGQVTPLKINGGKPNETMGLGRFLTITEAALIFHRVNVPNTNPAAQGIQVTLALEMATPMPGLPGLRDTYWTKVYPNPKYPGRKLEVYLGASAAPTPMEFCENQLGLVNIVNVSNHDVTQGRAFMPTMGFTNSMHYWPDHKGWTDPTNALFKGDPTLDPKRTETGGTNPAPKNFIHPVPATNIGGAYKRGATVMNYPYISKPIAIGTASTFKFNGPALIVEIHTGEAPNEKDGDPRSTLVQTIELTFPHVAGNLPVPTGGNLQPFGSRFDGSMEGREDCLNYSGASDIVRSIELTCGAPVLNQKGDIRIAAARSRVPETFFEPRGTATAYNDVSKPRVHGLQGGWAATLVNETGGTDGLLVAGSSNRNGKNVILPKNIAGVKRSDGGPGEFDRGLSKHLSSAAGGKVDEGNLKFDYGDNTDAGKIPYFRGRGIEETGQSYFSPNRQIPSPVMLGSLPTGVKALKPWQTLLFRPDRETGAAGGHPGGIKGNQPPDHLWLDLFHMPVVEPFAISEPFSTMGKVNMNYVIAPFGYAAGETKGGKNNPTSILPRSYLRRDTALRGVLKSTFMMMVPTSQPEFGHTDNPHSVSQEFRFPINLDKTIEEFESRLNDQRSSVASRPSTLFRSASEICDVDFFPLGPSVSTFATFWDQTYGQTGDNMRERPYAHIYPRLTTKSNVYTVYMRTQAIRKSPKSKPNEFDPAKDTVVGEYRGSATLERFIDPNDQALQNYDPVKESAEPYYRYRIVGTKHFAPQ